MPMGRGPSSSGRTTCVARESFSSHNSSRQSSPVGLSLVANEGKSSEGLLRLTTVLEFGQEQFAISGQELCVYVSMST